MLVPKYNVETTNFISFFSNKRQCIAKDKDKCECTERSASDCDDELRRSTKSSVSLPQFSTDKCAISGPSVNCNSKQSIEREIKYQQKWECYYDWLYFDRERGGAFCKSCEMHLKNDIEALQKTGGVFISVPFTKFRKATGSTGKLEKHTNSEKHARAVALENCRLQGLNAPIHTQIFKQNENEKAFKPPSIVIFNSKSVFP